MRAEAHLHITRANAGELRCVSFRRLPRGYAEYASALHLTKATFAVQPAGKQRFLDTGQKNVHAYVRGELQSVTHDRWPTALDPDWREAYYNPALVWTFIDREFGHPVHVAKEAVLIGKKVYYR